jgi:type I restriction enzyme S subunit
MNRKSHRTVRLKELAEISSGRSVPSQDEYWGGDIPRAKIGDIESSFLNETHDHLTRIGLENSGATLLPKGTLLVSATGTIGKVTMLEEKMAISQDIKSLKVDEKGVDPNYLLYYLSSKQERLEQLSSGATIKSLTHQELGNLRVELPPIEEQRKIGKTMKQIDQLIENTEEKLELLGKVKQEVSENFFQKSKSQEKRSLGDISEIKMGRSTKSEDINKKGEGLPYIQDQKDFGIRYPRVHRWTVRPSAEAEPGQVILLVRGGDIGRTNVANKEIAIGRGVAKIKPEKVRTKFLYHYLDYRKPRIKQISGSGSTNWIRKSELEKVKVPVLPESEEDKIVETLDAIDQCMMAESHRVEILQELKKSLFQELMKSKQLVNKLVETEGEEA